MLVDWFNPYTLLIHVYTNVLLLFILYLLHFIFRLGTKYSDVFTECVNLLASDEMYDNPLSLHAKKMQAVRCAKGCEDMCHSLKPNITLCSDINVLEKLTDALRCLYCLLRYYGNKRSHTRIGFCIYQIVKYQPLLMESRKSDCQALLTDIEIFCRHVVRFFVTTDNIMYLHEGIRLLYTTCRYLQDVIIENTCFHAMPPPPCPPPKKKKFQRRQWNY